MPTTQQALRQAAQNALDDGAAYACSIGTTDTVVIPALVNATTGASANRYDGAWVYLATGPAGTAGQQRLVQPGGFDPALGELTVFPPWTVVPAGGNIVEITHLFPSTDLAPSLPTAGIAGEDTSYRRLLNRSLGVMAKPAEISVAITTASTYSLAAYPYLDRESRLVRILEPDVDGDVPVPSDWRGWQLRLNAATPLLQVGVPFLTASDNLTLEVIRPCVNWIRSAGAWAQSTTGFTLDESTTDDNLLQSADVEVEDIMPVFLMCAYEVLAARSPGRPFPGAADLAETWRERAMASRLWDRTQQRAEAPQTAPVPSGGGA
jgi:hypothetical protein